jgi:hypothetical protein
MSIDYIDKERGVDGAAFDHAHIPINAPGLRASCARARLYSSVLRRGSVIEWAPVRATVRDGFTRRVRTAVILGSFGEPASVAGDCNQLLA